VQQLGIEVDENAGAWHGGRGVELDIDLADLADLQAEELDARAFERKSVVVGARD
jgi:hypothetical protein